MSQQPHDLLMNQAQTLPNGFTILGNTFTLTSNEDDFWADSFTKYLQDIEDRNIYVYGGNGDDVLDNGNFFNVQDNNLCPCDEEREGTIYNHQSPVTLHFFGEGGDDNLSFSPSGSSALYGGEGVDYARSNTGSFLLEEFEIEVQSEGIELISSNERLDPAITSTFISMDVEIIDGGHGGGYLMSDLLNGEVIYYARDEFDEIKSRVDEIKSRVSEDLNGDGFVDEFTNYRMWTASGGVNLTNRRGKTYSDTTSRMWDAEKAVQANTGFSVLIKHERQDGKYKIWDANEDGTVTTQSRWKSGDQMVTEGYEDFFALDLNGDSIVGKPPMVDTNGDGFVDGVTSYQIFVTDDRDLFLRNRNGKRIYSDATSSQWDAIKAVFTDTSINTLIEGTGRKTGKYKVWVSNLNTGRLTFQTRWQTEQAMLNQGYESVFNFDINENGIIGT